MSSPLSRVLRRLGRHEAVDEALIALAPNQLRTLLLHVFRQRAARPLSALREQQGRMAAVAAGRLDARANHALEGSFWQAVDPSYTGVTLAPVAPMGCHHVLAGTPQDNLLSATRALEVVGDPTVQLSLLAAAGRDGDERLRLASVSRALRMQRMEEPHHTRHFQIGCMVSSARALPDERFETEALREQLTALLRFVGLAGDRDRIGAVRVALTDMRLLRSLAADVGIDVSVRRPRLQQDLEDAGLPRFTRSLERAAAHQGACDRLIRLLEHLTPALKQAYPGVELGFDLGRARQITYFTGFAFHLFVQVEGRWTVVADGGLVDWVARLRSDQRERTLTSGIGLELFQHLGGR